MKLKKKDALESSGWKVGSAAEFLELTDAESILVDIKLALANEVRSRREKLNLTQRAFAKKLGSSQSRVAKLEAADRSVSLDLLVRSLATLGVTQKQIGRIVGSKSKPNAVG